MKRFCTLILFSLFSLLAASNLTSDGSAPSEVLSLVMSAIEENTENRGDMDFFLSSFSQESEDGYIIYSFTIKYNDNERIVYGFGKTEEEAEERIRENIKNMLFYEESFFSDLLRLDYISRGSYSFLNGGDHYRKGTRMKALDSTGKVRAVFEVSNNFSEASLLSPIYLSSVFPGMTLKKGGNWVMNAKVAMGIWPDLYEVFSSVSVGRVDLIYPLVPSLVMFFRYGSGKYNIYGGAEIAAYINLNKIFSTSFTLIEEGRIGASVSVLVGGGSDGFDWGVNYDVFYEHNAFAFFNWKIGYGYYFGSHSVIIGAGGSF